MNVVPCTIANAKKFISLHHRHNKAPVGALFAIGLEHDGAIIGVATVGRPVARMLQHQGTAEVTRLCVIPDSPKGACSMLYAACWRAWRAMGGERLVTYTLKSEGGASLRGAGWRVVGEINASKNRSWNCEARPREHQEIYQVDKFRWEKTE